MSGKRQSGADWQARRDWWRYAAGGALLDLLTLLGLGAVVQTVLVWDQWWPHRWWQVLAVALVWGGAALLRTAHLHDWRVARRTLELLREQWRRWSTDADCPFCAIIEGTGPAEVIEQWDDATALVPLAPVTDDPARHWLVIPHQHAVHAAADPDGAAAAVRRAAQLAAREGFFSFNLVVSAGAAATQTVPHTHVHLVERRPDDGLHLPWTGQQLRNR